MENKYASITFNAQVKPIKPVNNEFEMCKIYVHGIGKNRNGTYLSKDNTLKYLNTLNYCPVVGHIIECKDTDGNVHRYMGGHDYEFTEDWEIKELTVPYGVVVEDSFDFEIVNEYGIDVEYLTANAIMWTGRYPELKDCIYSENIWFNESMEISIADGKWRPYEEDSNYTEVLEWNYSALCLLGKADADSTTGHTDKNEHTEPCFISSRVIPLEFSKSEFASAMNEMKEKMSLCFNNQSSSTTDEVDIEIVQEVNSMAEPIKEEVVEEITETESVAEESVVEEVTTESVEEVVENVQTEEVVGQTTEDEFEVQETSIEEDSEIVEESIQEEVFEQTETQVENVIEEQQIQEEVIESDVVEESEVFTIEQYNKLKTEYEKLEKEFADYKEAHSFLNSDYEILQAYREAKETEERQLAENTLFANYEKTIGNTKEFKELKEKASEFSLDELKKECLCIVGMYSMTQNTKEEIQQPESLRFSLDVEAQEVEEDPYGGVFEKYLNR